MSRTVLNTVLNGQEGQSCLCLYSYLRLDYGLMANPDRDEVDQMYAVPTVV